MIDTLESCVSTPTAPALLPYGLEAHNINCKLFLVDDL